MLETVLLGTAQYDKRENPDYNEETFLNELIKREIPGANVKVDVVIIGGEHAFELDRSVPKIGTRGNNGYLGNPKDLIFPVVTVAEITQADQTDNYITAKVEITVSIDEKAENGIDRIEIWQNGVKLDTIDCNSKKTITTEYKANRNGIYTIKAYSKITDAEISDSAITTVEGIVPAVEFTPNGNTEWKKSHTTTVTVKETNQKVKNMKYLWKKSDEGNPKEGEFTLDCANNSQITGQGETMTGKYRLWVLVTLETGTNQKTYVTGSEEFYFDNEGPKILQFSYSVASSTGYTLNCTTDDDHSGIAQYVFKAKGQNLDSVSSSSKSATSKTLSGVPESFDVITCQVSDILRKRFYEQTHEYWKYSYLEC